MVATAPGVPTTQPDLQQLKAAFPQYNTSSLLYALRKHKFDGEAALRTLLTSSNTRFWREFHSCGQGLVGVGGTKPARVNQPPKVVVTPPATPAPPPEEVLSTELVDEVLEELLSAARQPEPEPEPEPVPDPEPEASARPEAPTEAPRAPTEGLGAALGTYSCAIKLSEEGRYAESIPLLERCLEVFEKELPAESSHTVRASPALRLPAKDVHLSTPFGRLCPYSSA